VSNFTNFFNKFKSNFDDTTRKSEAIQRNTSTTSSVQQDDPLSFKSAENVYQFLVDVI